MKDTNPKSAVGKLKVPLEVVPPSAVHYLAKAFADGAAKYGSFNWRKDPVSSMTYVGAAKRHLDSFLDGEDIAEDSLVEHLAHTMACCAIVLDALACGTLVDNRPPKGPAARLQAEYHVTQMQKIPQDFVPPNHLCAEAPHKNTLKLDTHGKITGQTQHLLMNGELHHCQIYERDKEAGLV
ncbi:MAG: dATP/dGTP diphosphohydrolase domain-containing protein [Pseudomonas sp.]